jgi:hypothetical protein
VEFPRFRRGHQAEASAAKVELPVEPGIKETLEREARRSGVTVEQLAVHAVFVYLADLEGATDAPSPGPAAGAKPGAGTLSSD